MARRGKCEYKEALRQFNRALVIYTSENDREGLAFAIYGRGGVLRYVGDFASARVDLLKSLELAPDQTAEVFTRMAIGGLYRMMGEYEKSLAEYQVARGLAEDGYARSYAECGIGNALRMTGEYRGAMRHFANAEKGYRKIGDRVSFPYTLIGITLIDWQNGREQPRLGGRLSEALEHFRKTKDHRGVIYVDLVRGIRTPSYARKALAAAKALGLRYEACHALFLLEGATTRVARAYAKVGAPVPETVFSLP